MLLQIWNFLSARSPSGRAETESRKSVVVWVYGTNFSGWIFCHKLVTFSSTLSINYTNFNNRMIKTKMFPELDLKSRVIIYVLICPQVSVYLSICLSICLRTEFWEDHLVSLKLKNLTGKLTDIQITEDKLKHILWLCSSSQVQGTSCFSSIHC